MDINQSTILHSSTFLSRKETFFQMQKEEEFNENLGDSKSFLDDLVIWMSFSKYYTGHYNSNGKNFYTWKGTIFLTVFLMIVIPLMSLQYLLPMFDSRITKSEFIRQPLSNSVGLTSNNTYSLSNQQDKFFKFSIFNKIHDILSYEESIQLPVFNYTLFTETFHLDLLGFTCTNFIVIEAYFKFGDRF